MFEVVPGFFLSLLAVVLVSRMTEGHRERECFERLMGEWQRPQDSVRDQSAVKTQGDFHEQ